MRVSRLSSAVLGLLIVTAAGCGKSPAPTAEPGAEPAAAAAPSAAPAAPDPSRAEADSPRLAAVQKAIDAYAVVRARLADDDLPGARKATADVAAQARAAAGQLSGDAATHLNGLATAAEKLATIEEIEAARAQFGEVSKALIQTLATDAGFQTGLVAYTCPMAQGYQKWVQTGDEMANPYMGKRMLKCGGKTKLVP